MGHLRITDFNDENKPRERLSAQGAGALSDQELLAILLGSGTKEMNVIDLVFIKPFVNVHGIAVDDLHVGCGIVQTLFQSNADTAFILFDRNP